MRAEQTLIGAKVVSMSEPLRFIVRDPEFGARLIVVWSLPGEGKSSIVNEFARQNGFRLLEIRATRMVPEDVGGYPVKCEEDGVMDFLPPRWLADAMSSDEPTIVLLEELNDARADVIAALQGVVYDTLAIENPRAIYRFQPNPNVRFIALSNPPGVSYNDIPLTPAFCNRAAHFTLLPDEAGDDEWLEWLVSRKNSCNVSVNNISPETARENFMRANMLVAGFLKANPQFRRVSTIDRKNPVFPSRRTWDLCARMMAVTNMTASEWSMVACATVGQAAAAQLIVYIQNTRLPNPVDVIKNPAILKEYLHPSKPDIAFAVMSGIIGVVSSYKTEDFVAFVQTKFKLILDEYKCAKLSDVSERLRAACSRYMLRAGILDIQLTQIISRR